MNYPAPLYHDAARRAAVEIDVSRRVDRGWGVCAGRAGSTLFVLLRGS